MAQAMTTTDRAMVSEYRVPWTTRLKMSRPTSSVPNRWCQLGEAK